MPGAVSSDLNVNNPITPQQQVGGDVPAQMHENTATVEFTGNDNYYADFMPVDNRQYDDYSDFETLGVIKNFTGTMTALQTPEGQEQFQKNMESSVQAMIDRKVVSDTNCNVRENYGHLFPAEDGWTLSNTPQGLLATNPFADMGNGKRGYSGLLTPDMIMARQAQYEQMTGVA